MDHVFHRNARAAYPTAVKGDGVFIVDGSGKRYIDASGGAAVSCLGHSNARVIEAIKAQLDAIPFAHTSFFTNDAMEALADRLAADAPAGIERVYFTSGGSEAVEAALKLARQYFVEIGQSQRRNVIARLQSYHGNTLGALAAGGNLWRRQQFEPLLIETHHIPPCFAYRWAEAGESEADYGHRAANELEAKIQELGEDAVMAFVAEPVVGATLGAVAPAEGYFRRVREICDKYGVLLILDEVMCGMGRTGTLHAVEQEGIAPDIQTVAKGLGAGYQPIGATMVSGRIFDTIRDGSGFFQHGHTYTGHATACAAALTVQDEIADNDLLTNVRAMGEALDKALTERLGNHRHVGDIRGRGLFQAVELVADRATKQAFDPALKLHARIKAEAMERGLMCYPMGGTIDGQQGDHVLLAPPYIVTPEQIDMIADRLAEAIDAAIESTGN
jgi:adenosylmethionine-8-amino-7-oxononanoate aminotransferase